ncbi:hypothetical protein ACRALDRAFT_1064202 [Sodiomyces alcalophilus JCM 7366]|uniref:uncharacterized protein n=1 Tax=Sodiomyces alcalophilus JCM 7366 TaxID=591952 RepID=UPI0039B46306
MQHQHHQEYELAELEPRASVARGPETDRQSRPSDVASSSRSTRSGWSLQRFWADNVNCVVNMDKSRDHLALERTYLAYLRTALMSAITGTIVAQLYVLQQPPSGFGYGTVGRPLASICYGFSICTVLLGTCRAWRHQHAMIGGKALTGGFEIVVLAIASLLIAMVFFGLLVGIDVVVGDSTDGHAP